MTFQSANSSLQVSQEPVLKKEQIATGNIPVFDADFKIKDSGVSSSKILTAVNGGNLFLTQVHFVGGDTINPDWKITVTASGTCLSVNPGSLGLERIGLVRLNCGATASTSNTCKYGSGDKSYVNMTKTLVFECCIKQEQVYDASTRLAQTILGFIDSDSTEANGAYFKYEGGTSPNWYCYTALGSVRTPVDSGVVIDTANFVTFKVEMNTTDCKFYINDLLVATIATTLPNSANAIGHLLAVKKTSALGTNTSTYSILCDWARAWCDLT